MSAAAVMRIGLYLVVLSVAAWALGRPLARGVDGEWTWPTRWLGPVERKIYALASIDPASEMNSKQYTLAVLLFNAAGLFALYALLRLQRVLPFNPAHLPGFRPDQAFNTAASFATNTNWQSYAGEMSLGQFVPLLGLTVQNFVSAATGLAVVRALVRGITRQTSQTIGCFWADLVRGILYILLPLSLALAIALASQGVVQTFSSAAEVVPVQSRLDAHGHPVTQTLPLGPVASQVAIKQIGTNGGGYFNANSAHPFENPTPSSNALEMLAILLIPAATCFAYGHWVKDTRQGWSLYAAMFVIFAVFLGLAAWAESQPNPTIAITAVDQRTGNMEGKEVRFGVVDSAVWAAATTAASNGSVNSMHDSYTPLGGLALLSLLGTSEVVFGGIGSGLYGMLLFVIVAVFIAGLMVGRTPEYLGKKIETYEMKMAALGILVTPVVALVWTAIATSTVAGTLGPANPAEHGFTEILYAFMSAANNNGSAFAGLDGNTPFYNTAIGLAILFGRYFVMVPVLAIAGSLARKKVVSPGAGTLPTHTPLFVGFLVGIVLLVGALNYLPAFALGPVVEHFHFISPG